MHMCDIICESLANNNYNNEVPKIIDKKDDWDQLYWNMIRIEININK